MDGFSVRIERTGNPDLLAFVLFQSVLSIDVIGLAAGILKNVLAARLHDRAAEGLSLVGRLGLGVVAVLIRGRLCLARVLLLLLLR
jgi:hypothetical protein